MYFLKHKPLLHHSYYDRTCQMDRQITESQMFDASIEATKVAKLWTGIFMVTGCLMSFYMHRIGDYLKVKWVFVCWDLNMVLSFVTSDNF